MVTNLWAMECAGLFSARVASSVAEPRRKPSTPESAGSGAAVPAFAALRQEPRTLELTGREVIVRAPGGAAIQRIPFDPGELTDFNRAFFMTTPDINFDGWPDLLLIASQGLQNIYYDGWLWDPEVGRYVYVPAVRELSSPVFDPKTRRVTTYEHGSATDHVSGVWEWIDGRLTEIERTEQTYDEETGLFTIRTYRLNPDGELTLAETRTLTEAELSSLS
jgi:hypothetical protein